MIGVTSQHASSENKLLSWKTFYTIRHTHRQAKHTSRDTKDGRTERQTSGSSECMGGSDDNCEQTADWRQYDCHDWSTRRPVMTRRDSIADTLDARLAGDVDRELFVFH